jgi:hypothetical protein
MGVPGTGPPDFIFMGPATPAGVISPPMAAFGTFVFGVADGCAIDVAKAAYGFPER